MIEGVDVTASTDPAKHPERGDHLTAEERHLIEAFIAENGVTRIEPGVSGVGLGASGTSWQTNRQGLSPAIRMKHSRDRQRLRDLLESGRTIRQIADELERTVSSVRRSIKQLKMSIKPAR